MARNLGGRHLGRVRTLFDVGTTVGLTDGQLLERFATRRDEGAELAFSALVERHGPMVLRVCRGVLRDEHDAHDAFQATFLVLARKGGSLWVRDSIGPWLFRVARRSACRAGRLRARRIEAERRSAELSDPRDDTARREELASIVHEEVERLPERYRSVIVLCDLEGRTCEEAARHLGCPVGTVGSRLSRGRDRLRDGLTRRGFAPRDVTITAAFAALRPDGTVLPSLVASTVEAVVRFASIRAVLTGTAAPLALGVLRSMSLNHWWKVASVMVAACAATTGFVAFVGPGSAVAQSNSDDPPRPRTVIADDVPATPVKSGPFRFVVEERGSVEVSKSADVFSGVEGQTTIISLLPEGTRVKKGQVVGELDSSALRDQLVNQQIAVEAAQEALVQAKSVLEVAEIAVVEYEQGIYLHERARLEGEIELADASVKRESDRLDRLRSTLKRLGDILAARKGAETPSDLAALVEVESRVAEAERSLAVEKKTLRNVQGELRILTHYTKAKTEGSLRSEVAKARQALVRVQAARELEESKKRKLTTQINRCKLAAPSDGVVVYANDPARSAGRTPNIEEGATVRERQLIFSIPDFDVPMRVSAKIREAIVDQMARGQTARIKVDAFPNETFEGVVESVAPLPDPASFFNRDVKVYTTRVRFSKTAPSLRPGMTANVEILVKSVDDALTIPVGAVIRLDGKYRVAVKKSNGEAEWRDVELGMTDGRSVAVKKGLSAGESVVLDPASLLTEEEKRKLSVPARSGPRLKAAAPSRKK